MVANAFLPGRAPPSKKPPAEAPGGFFFLEFRLEGRRPRARRRKPPKRLQRSLSSGALPGFEPPHHVDGCAQGCGEPPARRGQYFFVLDLSSVTRDPERVAFFGQGVALDRKGAAFGFKDIALDHERVTPHFSSLAFCRALLQQGVTEAAQEFLKHVPPGVRAREQVHPAR